MKIQGLEGFNCQIINGMKLYGHPLLSLESKSSTTIEEIVRTTGGEFLVVDEERGKFAIDLLGQFRIYWRIEKGEILLFRDFDVSEIEALGYELNKKAGEEISVLGYCVGQKTIYEKIFKVIPLFVYENRSKTQFSIKDLLAKTIRESLINSINHAVENYSGKEKKVALMYSGGKDSSFLAKLMNHNSIDFKAYSIVNKENEYNNVQQKAAQDGIQELEIFYYDPESINHQIRDRLVNEVHPAQMLFQCMSEIKEDVIVNGQNADALLALGPSENSILSFIRRIIIRERGAGFISRLIALSPDYGVVKNARELFVSSMYAHKYVFLKNQLVNKYIHDSDNNELDLDGYSNLEVMYLGKIMGYIQGSDSQVLYRIGDMLNKKVILPFSHPYILGTSVAEKYSNQTFFSKRILRE